MTIVTDDQVIEIKMLSDSKLKTVKESCKAIGLSEPAYYKRLRQLKKNNKLSEVKVKEIKSTIPITITSIIDDISSNLSDLKEMRCGEDNQKEYLNIMDREIKYHTSLMKALQTYNENRTTDESLRADVMAEITGWVFDTIQREMGRDKANEIIEILRKG